MFKIGKHEIGFRKPVYIVAEIGINHNCNLEIAKRMIESAAECGADAVKVQTFFPEEEFSEKLDPKLYNLVKQWSFTRIKDNLELKRHAQKFGIEFFSTPDGIRSAKLLKKVGMNCYKIASGSITNIPLIKTIAKLGKPMIISTGMTTLSEIAYVAEIVREHNCPFALLHVNSSYPTPIEDANLSTIQYLQKMFKVPIGYSDHIMGNDVCLAAVSLGACIIEKHFTLDKNMEGPDQKLSADPDDFRDLVTKIRLIEKSIGTPRAGVTKSEKKFFRPMRFSLGAAKDIPAGTKIKSSMLCTFRPASGIPPTMLDHIVGMTVKKDVKKDTMLTWDIF